MSGRYRFTQRANGIVLVLCALLAAGGCGNTERIVHGREFLDEGPLKVAALQPQCGCVSLRNTSNKQIMLESTFFGIARGSILLHPNEQTRVLFDWSGENNSDFYLIDAYDVDPSAPGQRGAQLKMTEVVSEYAPFVDTPCNDNACQFNGLAMNRMMEDHEELERENPTRGINFTSVLSVSAPNDECGCLMLTNFSDFDVTLRSMLHGTETGQFDLNAGVTVPVAFDWAGSLENDAYVIDAVDVRTPGSRIAGSATTKTPITSNAPSARPGSAMTIRLKDHVKIDGTLVNMTCQAEYSEFISHRGADMPDAAVRCPWNPDGRPGFGMRVAFDKHSQQKPSADAAKPAAAPKPQQ